MSLTVDENRYLDLKHSQLVREILLSFWKIHILHHASERSVYGQWMIGELRRHGYDISRGTLYPLLRRMQASGWLVPVQAGRGSVHDPEGVPAYEVWRSRFGFDPRTTEGTLPGGPRRMGVDPVAVPVPEDARDIEVLRFAIQRPLKGRVIAPPGADVPPLDLTARTRPTVLS